MRIGKKSTLTRKLQYCISIQYSKYLGNVFLLCMPTQYLQYFTICIAELKDYQHKVVGTVF